jgi:hypothetical protein
MIYFQVRKLRSLTMRLKKMRRTLKNQRPRKKKFLMKRRLMMKSLKVN